jgi:hypothetical protein
MREEWTGGLTFRSAIAYERDKVQFLAMRGTSLMALHFNPFCVRAFADLGESRMGDTTEARGRYGGMGACDDRDFAFREVHARLWRVGG